MSWHKCDNVESCALAVPAAVVFTLNLLHLWVGLSLFTLRLPPDLAVLLLVTVVRSLSGLGRWFRGHAQLKLTVGENDHYYVDEYSRSFSGECTKSGLDTAVGRLDDLAVEKVNDAAEHVVTQQQGEDRVCGTQQYTCCRSVIVPGCIVLTLVNGSAKPLEILVFYRYYQREFYQRLLRRLALG